MKRGAACMWLEVRESNLVFRGMRQLPSRLHKRPPEQRRLQSSSVKPRKAGSHFWVMLRHTWRLIVVGMQIPRQSAP